MQSQKYGDAVDFTTKTNYVNFAKYSDPIQEHGINAGVEVSCYVW